jgi:hypothetical protein
MAGCIPSSSPDETPSETINLNPSPASENVQVEVRWTYQDEYRFAVEISIENYPIPQGLNFMLFLKKATGIALLKEQATDQLTMFLVYPISIQQTNLFLILAKIGY